MPVHVEGFQKLRRKFNRLPQKARINIRQALIEGADELVAMQRRFVPIGQEQPRNGIRLRDSIQRLDGRDELSFLVVADDPVGRWNNARLQEFGTSSMPAQPFFFPPYRTLRKRIRGRINRAIKKAVRES